MNRLDTAILRTVLYADVFSFPLTVEEIHFFLIHDHPVSVIEIRSALATSAALTGLLCQDRGFIALRGREAAITERERREMATRRLWPLAERYGRWLARLPYVRMVAITGALAMRNAATHDDDLDFFLLTAAGRVWLARACAIVLVRLARLRGVTLCPNYIAAETALEQDHQTLFIAHEVAQMIPVYGLDLYAALRAANPWVAAHLPNASGHFHSAKTAVHGRLWRTLKQLAETALNNRLGDALEDWEHRRKRSRFAPQTHQPLSAARIDEQQVKGHFNDYGHHVLTAYGTRLRAYGLDDVVLPATGD